MAAEVLRAWWWRVYVSGLLGVWTWMVEELEPECMREWVALLLLMLIACARLELELLVVVMVARDDERERFPDPPPEPELLVMLVLREGVRTWHEALRRMELELLLLVTRVGREVARRIWSWTGISATCSDMAEKREMMSGSTSSEMVENRETTSERI